MSNNKAGFYYDIQKSDPITSMSLHCNVNLQKADGEYAIKDTKKDDDGQYFTEPLCTSILSEDFQVTINNSWTDFGRDPLGSVWEDLMAWGPIVNEVSDQIPGFIDGIKNLGGKMLNEVGIDLSSIKKKEGEKSKTGIMGQFLDYTSKISDTLSKAPDIAKELLSRPLIVQSTRYCYYTGTGTTFGNLGMKFTIFADWKLENGKYVWKSVHEQLSKLYPYIMGRYVSLNEQAAEIGLKTDFELDEFVGWQKPPGGFKADVKILDHIQEGTLKLKLGSYYSLPNLVVADSNLNYSKQMVKNPTAVAIGSLEDLISPLYCDVTLLLRPASKYTDITLENIITGKSMSEERKITTRLMKGRLEEERGAWESAKSNINL